MRFVAAGGRSARKESARYAADAPIADSGFYVRGVRYAQPMLAFFAALVPIVASLYVGVSFLAQYSRQAHDFRVYTRVDVWHDEQSSTLDTAQLGTAERERQRNALRDRRALLLRANEVDPAIGTLAHFGRMATPTGPAAVDVRRQWALLAGSSIGVVLLAIDQLNQV